jgi:Aspartyl protease
MKSPLLHASFWILLAAGFPITFISSRAEARCPGNIAGLHPRLVAGALLIVPVKINHFGPFDFMVDTGSQLNIIDSALAEQLHVKSQAKVGLVATTTVFQASVVVLDSLETGTRSMAKPLAVVQDLGPIQAADPRIRGVLGENFLAHFDVLIDYPHGLLCLDEANRMQSELRGERIPLVVSEHAGNDVPFSDRLVVSVHLSDTGSRPILLQVDSGSDGAILYAGKKELEEPLLKWAKLQGPEVGDARRAFAVLPLQDMKLGSRVVRKVPFVTPVSAALNAPDREEDGILATVLFQRVYVSHSAHFVIFDPK